MWFDESPTRLELLKRLLAEPEEKRQQTWWQWLRATIGRK